MDNADTEFIPVFVRSFGRDDGRSRWTSDRYIEDGDMVRAVDKYIGMMDVSKEVDDMTKNNEKILSSQNLHAELNEEREKKGLKEIPAVNPKGAGSTNTYARMDDSWKSAPDFFKQMIKKNKEKE